MMRSSPTVMLATALAFVPGACGNGGEEHSASPPVASAESSPHAVAPEAEVFWAALQEHCGRAHPGGLTLEPPGDEMLTGTEQLIVHFRECGRDTIRVPFHIEVEATGEWDRSRTWLFIRSAAGFELRHDHRQLDGTPDETTWYGAFTRSPGTADTQEFIVAERRAADGSELGWRVHMIPGERYTYGTIRGGAWTWRIDFDLSREVPSPPAPWGNHRMEGS
jgi:hypothetical protein